MSAIKHGDTIIEVVFSFMVFSTVSVASIGIMNSGLNQAQRSLEVTMARNSIDAQAEALRFLQNNFSAEREWADNKKQFTDIWNNITAVKGVEASAIPGGGNINKVDYKGCEDVYQYVVYDNDSTKSPAFILNTRLIQPKTIVASNKYAELLKKIVISTNETSPADPNNGRVLRPSTLYPRLTYTVLMFNDELNDGHTHERGTNEEDSLSESRLYREVYAAEGIWVITVNGDKSSNVGSHPQYFDFYIQTCWQSVGTNAHSTLSTIVRLYNPEVIE
ncbi:hypothetical protein J5500_02685 [Candidatus Saccharibacteria bacterium]|nr:hypothetical protein [Candidatus Saccharibacteria bacterium]